MKQQLFGGLLLTAITFSACSDDFSNSNRYDDGLLHLKLSFNDERGRWAEGTAANTRSLTTTPMITDGVEGLTLYLHCEEQEGVDLMPSLGEETHDTRGQRISGEAFDDRNLLTSFGLYAMDEDGTERLDFTKLTKTGYALNQEGYYESNYHQCDSHQ